MQRKGPSQTIVEILRGLALSAFAVLPLSAEERYAPEPEPEQIEERAVEAPSSLRHYLAALRLRDYHV